jgi:hypothetical protein
MGILVPQSSHLTLSRRGKRDAVQNQSSLLNIIGGPGSTGGTQLSAQLPGKYEASNGASNGHTSKPNPENRPFFGPEFDKEQLEFSPEINSCSSHSSI